jgi:heme-degrading monooxygenase HmoA
MAFMLVSYKIEDYKRWKNTFNDAFDMRKKAGEKSSRVFKRPDNPNEMVVLQEWDSLASARRFAKSKALHNCMKKAGVVGKPDIVFLKELSLPIASLQVINLQAVNPRF